MSHVSIGEATITNLQAVVAAAQNLGLECLEQKDYRWFGTHVGDWPLPPGWKKEEIGHNATLVLRVPEALKQKLGIKGECYDLAIVQDKTDPTKYVAVYDFFLGGKGLEKVVGQPVRENGKITTMAPEFVMHYNMCNEAAIAGANLDEISFDQLDDGSWVSYTQVNEERLKQ